VNNKPKISRRDALKLCTLSSAALLSGCAFKFRDAHRYAPLLENAEGLIAKSDALKAGTAYLAKMRDGLEIILINTGSRIVAYKSICPHTACELNDGEGMQLTENNELRCFIHDSFFNIETGECLRGPALFRGPNYSALPKFPIRIENGHVFRESFVKSSSPS
jgi:nitrite reductase/ring-hydroxylating ferredoxin subunit